MKRHVRLTALAQSLIAGSALALGGCAGQVQSATEMADVTVAAAAIPADGQCAHIVVTRLADFQTTEFRGLLVGATIKAPLGEDRVTATAYPTPCASEPASAPWTADAQTQTFVTGANTITLNFHQTVDANINPNFDDTQPLVVRAGSQVRISRNGEDIAGPNFALDGWEVKQLTLPPAAVKETVVFSLDGKGVPYTPRGMARMPDGSFVFQLSEVSAPLYAFSATGAALGQWAVSYPAGTTQWDNTDGLEAVDATHLVRTGWVQRPNGCDATGAHCKQSGLDILEKRTAADGSTVVVVTKQIFLPELAAEALNTEYPVGVAPVGARFAVAVLPNAGTTTSLVLLNADGTAAVGPKVVASNDVEGLFDDGAGRLVAVDYLGNLSTYNDTDLTPRAGETASLGEGVGFAAPVRLTWRSAGSGSLIAFNGSNRLVSATPDFASITDLGIDLSSFTQVGGVEYKSDTDELLLMDRFPANATPTVVAYSLTTKAKTTSTTLQPGLAVTLRPWGVAYIPSTHQLVAHYRRAGSADPTLDAVAFVHNADGTLATKFDLAQWGFARISSVRYDSGRDQLLFLVVDTSGVTRIVTTDRSFNPKRSYRTDVLPDLSDLTLMSNGPFAGDYGVTQAQPSYFARIALP
jgi:hypothetical protein